MKGLATLGTVIFLAAGALAAQQDTVRPMGPGPHCMGPHCPQPAAGMGMMQMGGGMGMMGGSGPMARTMAFAPDRLLEHQAALGLSEEQVNRLMHLSEAAKSAAGAQQELARKYMDELAKLAGSTDTTKIRRAFMAHHEAMGGAHWISMRAAVLAQGVLNDVQRARVNGWVDAAEMRPAQGAGMGHGPGPNRP